MLLRSFLRHRLYVHLDPATRVFASIYFQGRRVMKSFDSIQGSHTLSRYGDRRLAILPSVLPTTSCKRREGSTDLSRFLGRDRSRHGQFDLPDKEFRSVLLHPGLGRVSRFDSAHLCMSPCSSDHIIIRL
jgi:hypothetical protein